MGNKLQFIERLNGEQGALVGVYKDGEITRVLRMPTVSLIERAEREKEIAKELGPITETLIEGEQ